MQIEKDSKVEFLNFDDEQCPAACRNGARGLREMRLRFLGEETDELHFFERHNFCDMRL